MIMARNEDGTYSQVGFVKDNAGIDTEYIYDKDGDIVFEKGFTRETSGTVPLTINGIGKDLKAWSITGNTVQNGTPTPENPVEVQAVGDRTANLFDKNDCTVAGYIKNDGTISITADNWFTTKNYIKCSGTITLTALNGLGNSVHIACYDEQKNLLGTCQMANTNQNQSTINLIDGTKYIKACSRNNNLDSFMLNAGSIPLPYEPYGYKIPVVTSADGTEPITTPIYLPTPLYSGEVLRSDGSRDVKWGKLVLTGKETISKNTNESTNYLYYMPISANKKINGYCSHLISRNGAPMSVIGFNTNSSFAVIYFNFGADIMNAQPSGNTMNGFKEYLAAQYAAGTPVTVWYPLATPTTETFTAPQIPTINGTTVIDVDTAVKPTEMYTKYKSSK